MDPGGTPQQEDALEILAVKHTLWLTAGGLIGAVLAFGLTLLALRNNPDAAKYIPAALGALLTFLGTILGHLQGAAVGRAAASKSRREADALRNQMRTHEKALPDAPTNV
jgi:hypothetical protein